MRICLLWLQETKFCYKTRHCLESWGRHQLPCEIDKLSFYFISSDTVLSKFHLQGVSVLSFIMEGNDPRTPQSIENSIVGVGVCVSVLSLMDDLV